MLLGLAVVLVAGAVSYHLSEVPGAEGLDAFALGLPTGVITGLLFVAIFWLWRYGRALCSDEILRKMQIEEADKRNRMIRDKIGGVGFPLSIGIIWVAGAAFSFFSGIISMTLFAALLVMALVMLGLKVYYRKRY